MHDIFCTTLRDILLGLRDLDCGVTREKRLGWDTLNLTHRMPCSVQVQPFLEQKNASEQKGSTDLLVVPEVDLAEGPGAAHARLQGLHLPSDAGVAGHLPGPGEIPAVGRLGAPGAGVRGQVERGPPRGPSGQHQPLELGGDFGQDPVDAHLGPLGVALLAHGAQELLAVVPVALQTGLAEAVSAGRGDGLHEHLQADGAGELVLGEDAPSRRAHVCAGRVS